MIFNMSAACYFEETNMNLIGCYAFICILLFGIHSSFTTHH